MAIREAGLGAVGLGVKGRRTYERVDYGMCGFRWVIVRERCMVFSSWVMGSPAFYWGQGYGVNGTSAVVISTFHYYL